MLFGLGLVGRETVEAAAGGQAPVGLSGLLDPLWIGLTENWLGGDRGSVVDFLNRQIVREVIATIGH